MSIANAFIVPGLLLSLLVATSKAQDTTHVSEVKVTVVDPTGAVIANSEVAFKSDSKTIVAHTANNGSVAFKLQTGQYAVTVSVAGFKKKEISDFQVVAPLPSELRVALEIDPRPTDIPFGGLLTETPTTTSDVPNAIPLEPVPDSPPPVTNEVEIKKVHSSHCLYLWKCSTAYVRSVANTTSRSSPKTAQ
jgi:hypothetical protein